MERELRTLRRRQADLQAAVEEIPVALARNVSAAIDAAGGDDALVSGLARVEGHQPPPPADADPRVARLATELAEANRRVDAYAAVATVGEAGQVEMFRRQLVAPVEAELAAIRRSSEAAATAEAAASLWRVLDVIARLRSGDLATVRAVLDAARGCPDAFPDDLADRLSDATGEALVEAGVVLAELIEGA